MKIAADLRPLLEPRAQERGVGVYTQELISALTLHGPEHHWVGFSNTWLKTVILSEAKDLIPHNSPPITLITKPLPNKLLNLSLLTTGRPYLDQWADGADVWIAPNLNFTSISPRCKLIQVVHDLSFLVNPSWYSLKSRLWHHAIRVQKVLNRADAIVAISKATATDLARHFPNIQNKIHVIYPGAPTAPIIGPDDQRAIRKKYRLPARFFLYVGALEPRKNIRVLLDAFTHFTHTTAYPHELILAGPGNKNVILSVAKNLIPIVLDPSARGLRMTKHRIRHIGPVSTKTKHTLMSLAEALVFPSLYEGFGFPPLEAMSHCTPVIASWSTSLPEVVGDAGLLVSPYKPHELAHAMRMIADHQEVREDLSRRALVRAKKFTWEKTAQEFLELCTSP